jgi:hypothetical protein
VLEVDLELKVGCGGGRPKYRRQRPAGIFLERSRTYKDCSIGRGLTGVNCDLYQLEQGRDHQFTHIHDGLSCSIHRAEAQIEAKNRRSSVSGMNKRQWCY